MICLKKGKWESWIFGWMGMLVVFELIVEGCWIGWGMIVWGWGWGIIIFWGYCFLYNFCNFFLMGLFLLFFNIWRVWFISLCFFFDLDCFVKLSNDWSFEIWKFNNMCCVERNRFDI